MTVKELLKYATYIDGNVIVYGYDDVGNDAILFQFVGVPLTSHIPSRIANAEIEGYEVEEGIFRIYTMLVE